MSGMNTFLWGGFGGGGSPDMTPNIANREIAEQAGFKWDNAQRYGGVPIHGGVAPIVPEAFNLRAADFFDERGNLTFDKAMKGGFNPMDSAVQTSIGGPPINQTPDRGEWVMLRRGQVTDRYSSEGGNMGQTGGDVYAYVQRENQAAPTMPTIMPPRQDDPAPDGPSIYDSWDAYQNIARAETEGMNRMPFVGPNWQRGNPTYADIPYNPLLSLEMFYPGIMNEWRDELRDPLEGALLTPIATAGGGGGFR